jgi:tetratricopeptide (TPR) repeat protein
MRSALPFLLLSAWLAGCATTRPAFRCESRGGRPWIAVTSESFAIVTDLDEDDARELAGELGRVRDGVSASLFQRRHDPPVRVTVIAFRSTSDYQSFAPPGSAAYYARGASDPKIVMPGSMDMAQRRILAHEMAHHVASYVLLRIPRWFSEGLATWAETVGTTSSGIRMVTNAVPPGRRPLARPQRIPARDLLAWGNDVQPEDPAPYYDAAWLLVHFLVNQDPDGLRAFEARLASAEDPDRAFREVFPQWNPDMPGGTQALDRELDDWVKNGRYDPHPVRPGPPSEVVVRPLPSAEVHAIRVLLWAGGTAGEGDAVAIRAELDEGLAEDPGHPVLLRELAHRQGLDPLPLARISVKAHPGDPRAWSFLAESLPAGAIDEREAALRRARELAPRKANALASLAALLLDAGRSGEALPLARQAVLLSPFSPAVLDIYAAVTADLGNCQQALVASQRVLDVLPEGSTPADLARFQARQAAIRSACTRPGP